MAEKCAAYGRFITQPAMRIFVFVGVLAINVGIIIGSSIWTTTLVSNVNELWINPASIVARNNRIVDAFKQEALRSETELFMMNGLVPGDNVAAPNLVDQWFQVSKKIFEIVVVVDGTSYTTFDICSGRASQSPYILGCSWFSPIDYFREAGEFTPKEATATWLVDEKLAHIDNFKEWEWAINAYGIGEKTQSFLKVYDFECFSSGLLLFKEGVTPVSGGGPGFPAIYADLDANQTDSLFDDLQTIINLPNTVNSTGLTSLQLRASYFKASLGLMGMMIHNIQTTITTGEPAIKCDDYLNPLFTPVITWGRYNGNLRINLNNATTTQFNMIASARNMSGTPGPSFAQGGPVCTGGNFASLAPFQAALGSCNVTEVLLADAQKGPYQLPTFNDIKQVCWLSIWTLMYYSGDLKKIDPLLTTTHVSPIPSPFGPLPNVLTCSGTGSCPLYWFSAIAGDGKSWLNPRKRIGDANLGITEFDPVLNDGSVSVRIPATFTGGLETFDPTNDIFLPNQDSSLAIKNTFKDFIKLAARVSTDRITRGVNALNATALSGGFYPNTETYKWKIFYDVGNPTGALKLQMVTCLTSWPTVVDVAVLGATLDLTAFRVKSKILAQMFDGAWQDARMPKVDAQLLMDSRANSTRAQRDAAGVAELLTNPLTPEDAIMAIRRHDTRPPYAGKTEAELLKILSGIRNDIPAQAESLKQLIFGQTTPRYTEVHGGYCECYDEDGDGSPDYAGLKCDVPRDKICDCDASFNDDCIAAVSGGCKKYAECAGYDNIKALLDAAPALGFDVAEFVNFEEEIQTASGLVRDRAKVSEIIGVECINFVPCVETEYANELIASSAPNTTNNTIYGEIMRDAMFSYFLLGDITEHYDLPKPAKLGYFYRTFDFVVYGHSVFQKVNVQAKPVVLVGTYLNFAFSPTPLPTFAPIGTTCAAHAASFASVCASGTDLPCMGCVTVAGNAIVLGGGAAPVSLPTPAAYDTFLVVPATKQYAANAVAGLTTTAGSWIHPTPSGPITTGTNVYPAGNVGLTRAWNEFMTCTNSNISLVKDCMYGPNQKKFQVADESAVGALTSYCPAYGQFKPNDKVDSLYDYYACFVSNFQPLPLGPNWNFASQPITSRISQAANTQSRLVYPYSSADNVHPVTKFANVKTLGCSGAPSNTTFMKNKQNCVDAIASIVILGISDLQKKHYDFAEWVLGTSLTSQYSGSDFNREKLVLTDDQEKFWKTKLVKAVGNGTLISTKYSIDENYAGITAKRRRKAYIKQANSVLDSICTEKKKTPITNIYFEDCGKLFGNIAEAVKQNQTAITEIGKGLAKYAFVGTVIGACDQKKTGRSQLGNNTCWEDSDCRLIGVDDKFRKGNCTNLTSTNPFTKIEAFGSIFFSATPEKMILNLKSKYAQKYRRLANQRLLNNSVGLPGRRQLAVDPLFGQLDNHTINYDQANAAIKMWRTKFMEVVNSVQLPLAAAQGGNLVGLSRDAPEDIIRDLSSSNFGIIVLGYMMMALYATIVLGAYSTNRVECLNGGRSLVGVLSVLLVTISVGSGLSLALICGFRFSAAATQVLPYVMLGLGVDDVFVFIRTFPTYREGVTSSEGAATALAISGPSMLLTSVTNAGVFACTVFTGMPVVVNMSIQASFCILTNFFTVITCLPPLLTWDYERQARGKSDCAVCVTVGVHELPKQTAEEEKLMVARNCFNRTFVPIYSRLLTSPVGVVITIIAAIVLVTLGVIGEMNSELGLQLSDVTPKGSALQKALVLRDNQFPVYTLSVATLGADFSNRTVQQNIKTLWDNVNNLPHILKDSGVTWQVAFMAWGLPNVPNYDLYAEKRVCDPSSATTEGYCGQKYNCTVITEDKSVVDGNIPFYSETDYYRCLNIWINVDLLYEALNPGFKLIDQDAPKGQRQLYLYQKLVNNTNRLFLPYSQGGFFAKDLQRNSDFVELIAETRALLNDTSDPPAFGFGPPITFWDQYADLKRVIEHAIAIALLLKFVCMTVIIFVVAESDIPNERGNCRRMIVSVWGALVVSMIVTFMVYEVYGFITYAGVKISAIPVVSIIMSVGVGVNIAAHVILGFINAHGTRRERVITTLDIFFAPVVDGATTTFLGVVLLSLSPFTFIVIYFFYVWLIIIIMGVFNGIMLLPVVLLLIGPPNLHRRGTKRTNKKIGTSG